MPGVDATDGPPLAVALQQQRGASNPRSSVGSVTTLFSLVRMMYSRAGAYPANQPMLYAEDFSPDTRQGACSTCHGLGHVYEVTEAHIDGDLAKISISGARLPQDRSLSDASVTRQGASRKPSLRSSPVRRPAP